MEKNIGCVDSETLSDRATNIKYKLLCKTELWLFPTVQGRGQKKKKKNCHRTNATKQSIYNMPSSTQTGLRTSGPKSFGDRNWTLRPQPKTLLVSQTPLFWRSSMFGDCWLVRYLQWKDIMIKRPSIHFLDQLYTCECSPVHCSAHTQ